MLELSITQILTILGVPSVASMFMFLFRQIQHTKHKTDAVTHGLQALLRSQMVHDYNRWSERGYAPIYARENFENCWVQYESLGENGVMNNIHEKFMALPTQLPKK